MTTTTIEEQLADIRRRIGRLHALAHVEGALESSRVRRHLEAVRRDDAAVEAAAASAPDEVEARVAQLKRRLVVAEHAVAADAAGNWATFASAVEAELESWDTYLERLQTTVATRAWDAREQAEAAIGDLRSRRIAIEELLAEARHAAGNGWHAKREFVSAARDELEQMADDLSAKLN